MAIFSLVLPGLMTAQMSSAPSPSPSWVWYWAWYRLNEASWSRPEVSSSREEVKVTGLWEEEEEEVEEVEDLLLRDQVLLSLEAGPPLLLTL